MLGLIVKAISGYYYVMPHGQMLPSNQLVVCRGKGIFRKNDETPLVGDLVKFEETSHGEGTVIEILPRKNELLRPPIANVDVAVVIFSIAEPTLNLHLLDKFLIYLSNAKVPCVICFTKSDLLDSLAHHVDKKNKISEVEILSIINLYEHIGYEVTLNSSKLNQNVKWFDERLKNATSVFFGQSGVGKSSLLNQLIPSIHLETNTISKKLGRGKHTTRHVELLPISQGGYIADTPGFSQLDLLDMDVHSLEESFVEFQLYRILCKFRGCLHQHEPGCHVKEAVKNGLIASSRYEHYLMFCQEIKERKKRY